MTIAPEAPTALRFLSLEITARCQLACTHCYAEAGPTRGHGSMTGDDWHRIIDEAADLGTTAVQIIGGEPTLHPAFSGLVEHALRVGMRVRVYSNLIQVRDEHWRLFEHPHVSVAASYYSDNPGEHHTITGGRRDSHAATRANIVEALNRGVRIKVGIIDMGGGQRAQQARAEMQALGVHDVHVDQVRAVGNASGTVMPSTSALCGRCGVGKAAILPDGSVAPCEIGRFLPAGSVRDATLASVLASDRWAQVTASVPHRAGADSCAPDCQPAASDSCNPAKGNPCNPMG
ncbi:radical SAM protein [Streptomyces sp. SID4919]|uniref:radical SAM/SPASM domain-containing protein n=1 Tax=unclassified Streptomyces TaxID=2593676 RepID=UPI000823A46A|nr:MULTISPECIES: radical SAM protein [unclassified Streptomyces]MYY11087.1 radical SAM protein [Streptomyces sp. SID4919]SCK15233.1 4Fe-4S single cluster domain-containing protein [Streptomyces sp. AmelKG-E11A]